MHPRTARAVAALSAAFWVLPFFGLIDLVVIFLNDPEWKADYLLELGWGLLFTVLVGAPLLAGAVRGVTGLLVAQLFAVALAVVAAALWTGYLPQLVPAAVLALDAALLAWLAGLRGRGVALDPWLRVVVVVGAVGAGAFAAATVAAFPASEADVTWGLDHEPMQVGLRSPWSPSAPSRPRGLAARCPAGGCRSGRWASRRPVSGRPRCSTRTWPAARAAGSVWPRSPGRWSS